MKQLRVWMVALPAALLMSLVHDTGGELNGWVLAITALTWAAIISGVSHLRAWRRERREYRLEMARARADFKAGRA